MGGVLAGCGRGKVTAAELDALRVDEEAEHLEREFQVTREEVRAIYGVFLRARAGDKAVAGDEPGEETSLTQRVRVRQVAALLEEDAGGGEPSFFLAQALFLVKPELARERGAVADETLLFNEFFDLVGTVCTFSEDMLLSFVFDCFDTARSGKLDYRSVRAIKVALAGDAAAAAGESSNDNDADAATPAAPRRQASVSQSFRGASMSTAHAQRSADMLYRMLGTKSSLSREDFVRAQAAYPQLSWPMFRLQQHLRKITLGSGAWKESLTIVRRRRRRRASGAASGTRGSSRRLSGSRMPPKRAGSAKGGVASTPGDGAAAAAARNPRRFTDPRKRSSSRRHRSGATRRSAGGSLRTSGGSALDWAAVRRSVNGPTAEELPAVGEHRGGGGGGGGGGGERSKRRGRRRTREGRSRLDQVEAAPAEPLPYRHRPEEGTAAGDGTARPSSPTLERRREIARRRKLAEVVTDAVPPAAAKAAPPPANTAAAPALDVPRSDSLDSLEARRH